MEHRYPKVRQAVQEFYDRRTKGVRPRWLGRGYDKSEKTRRDSFVHPYMGKVYKNGSEILSMGLEMMYQNPGKLIALDPDYADFIFAIMNGKGYI